MQITVLNHGLLSDSRVVLFGRPGGSKPLSSGWAVKSSHLSGLLSTNSDCCFHFECSSFQLPLIPARQERASFSSTSRGWAGEPQQFPTVMELSVREWNSFPSPSVEAPVPDSPGKSGSGAKVCSLWAWVDQEMMCRSRMATLEAHTGTSSLPLSPNLT